MKGFAIIAACMSAAAMAQAQTASTLEERAQKLAVGFQRLVPLPLGTKGTITNAQAQGTTLTMNLDAKVAPAEYDRGGEPELIKDVCSAPTPSTEFIADGGSIRWAVKLDDGAARSVTLTRQNCNPVKQPATLEELQQIVKAIKPNLPFFREDGVLVQDVSAGPGAQLVFLLSLDKLIPRERVPALRADLGFAMGLSRMTKLYCGDDNTQLMLKRGVKYVYIYQSWGMKIYETTMTPEFCGLK